MPELTQKQDTKDKSHQSPQPSAAVQAPAPPPEPRPEITYQTRFLAPQFEEIDAAAFLLRKLYPELPEEMLNECLTDRLNMEGFNKGTEIYVIVRKSYGRRRLVDAQGYREDRDGMRITVNAGAEVLAADMKIYGPVRAKDHWVESSNGWHSELNRGSFLEQVGKLSAPWAILQPDAPGKRGGELPKFVMLSSC